MLGMLIVVALATTGLTALRAASQETLSVKAAADLFNKLGCTGCHAEGGTAMPLPKIIVEIQKWGEKYATIDEAVYNEVVYFGEEHAFKTFKDLMAEMANNVGVGLEDVEPLSQFFKAVFEGKVNVSETELAKPAETRATTGRLGELTAGAAAIAGAAVALLVIAAALLASRRR
jgi:hypothetical protein